jgi:hypothetical protein
MKKYHQKNNIRKNILLQMKKWKNNKKKQIIKDNIVKMK